MVGILAALRAVARAEMRSVRSIGSVAGNNFFLFVLLLAQQPSSAVFLFLLIGLLILSLIEVVGALAVPVRSR